MPVTHRRGWQGSRRGLLGFAGAGGLLLLARGTRAFARASPASLLANLRVANGGRPFAGDRPLLATVGQQGRDRPDQLHARPPRDGVARDPRDRPGRGVGAADEGRGGNVADDAQGARRGTPHARLDACSDARAAHVHRARSRPAHSTARWQTKQAVVRLLGVDAAFAERSAAPGTDATLVVRTDAKSLIGADAAQRA